MCTDFGFLHLGEGSSDKFEIALVDEGYKAPSLHLVQGKFPTLNNNSATMHRYSRNRTMFNDTVTRD